MRGLLLVHPLVLPVPAVLVQPPPVILALVQGLGILVTRCLAALPTQPPPVILVLAPVRCVGAIHPSHNGFHHNPTAVGARKGLRRSPETAGPVHGCVRPLLLLLR